MISYIVEDMSVQDFEFWGGATETVAVINKQDSDVQDGFWSNVERFAEDDGLKTETEINDYVWFDALDELEGQGYKVKY